MEAEDQEISINDLLKVFVKRWKLIIIPGITASLITLAVLSILPRKYESYALLKLGYVGTNQFETVDSIAEIMSSLPMRIEIASKIKEINEKDFVESLKDRISYRDASGLLKIGTTDRTAHEATALVKAITEIICTRHQHFYDDSQKQLYGTIEKIKNFVKPIPLTTGIAEFKIEPTQIVIPAIDNPRPIPSKKKLTLLSVFFSVVFFCILIAIYQEGKNKGI